MQHDSTSTYLPTFFTADSGKRTVTGRRRRKTGDGPRERAKAPRREPSGGGSRPPSSSGGGGGSSHSPRPVGSSGGGNIPLNPKVAAVLVGLLLLFFICNAIFGLFGDDEPAEQQAAAVATVPIATEVAVARPTPTAVDFTAPAPMQTGNGDTWLVMLYQDADDKVLEQDIYLDLNEAERVGSDDRVRIVAQVDRYKGGFRGDGDWTDTRRIYLNADQDLNQLGSPVAQNLGEVNMAAAETLVDFATWAIETFPADHYVLILSDHGMGWPGGWSDPDPAVQGSRDAPLTAALGNHLYLHQMDAALGEIRSQTGIDQFELIGMDACLMGHLEVFSMLAPHARYAVASQETEPAVGWAYTSFLQTLQNNPNVSGAELGQAIVQSYIQDDQRIVDDDARAAFVGGSSPKGLFGLFSPPSAADLARQMEGGVTLTAVDLTQLPSLMSAVNDLSFAMQSTTQPAVAKARNYAQSFTSIFGDQVPNSYIDLGNFAQVLTREAGDDAIAVAADKVNDALKRAVIAERHGSQKAGATGVSIYFPNSQLYGTREAGPESYSVIAANFARQSLWDDFLAFHYTGRQFAADDAQVVVPPADQQVTAPGSGAIQVSPVTLSDNVAAPGKPILLSADISGENVGYILFFTGFVDEGTNSLYVADIDYIESGQVREIGGVYYPDWGEGDFTIEFEWEPLMFAISDGAETALALFQPQTYGATAEDAVYTVNGTYTYAADSSEHRSAQLHFRDGALRQIFGFSGDGASGAPREIIPRSGDTFTITEEWIELDTNQRVYLPGQTLTFGDEVFTWEALDAAVGAYVVGFMVQDLDGNTTQSFAPVTVQ